MKIRISTADLGKKLLIALWMFIIFIRQGAEYFIGNIAWYASPLLIGTIVVTLFYCILNYRYILVKPNTTYIILFLCALFIMMFNNYDFKNNNYNNILFYFTMFLMFLIFRNIDSSKWADALIKYMIVVGLFYSFWTIATYFSSNIFYSIYGVLSRYAKADLLAYYKSGYISGLTIHWTTNGVYTSLGFIAASCSFFFFNGTKNQKRMYAIFSLITLLALLLTAKRAHLVFSLSGLLITFYFYGANNPFSRLFKILLIIVVALLVFYVVAMFIPGIMNSINRTMGYIEKDDITNGREFLQEEAYKFIRRNYIFGNGWEYFTYNNNSFMPGNHAHNVYLQLLCDSGIIGFTVFISIFAIMLFRSISALIKIRKKKNGCVVSEIDEKALCISICYQLFFLLYCTTGNPLYDRNCFFPYIMLCAASVSVINKIDRQVV